jgi:thiol-disulfide isomerase/thioredoxin
MKKIFTYLAISFSGIFSFAQVGAVAPNFTQNDLNGTTHDLYTYLNAGKVVVVDMSATWCGPCWGFHQAHYLQELHDEFGPGGTNEAVILFYEDDVTTTLADINGTTGATQGNWTTGVTYPIINATLTLPAQYGTGYPTVSVICPSDKKIKSNLFQFNTLSEMRANVQSIIDQCSGPLNTNEISLIETSLAPNPATDKTSIQFNVNSAKTVSINLFSVSGQLINSISYEVVSGSNTIDLDVSNLELGTYFIQLSSTDGTSKMMNLVKQ